MLERQCFTYTIINSCEGTISTTCKLLLAQFLTLEHMILCTFYDNNSVKIMLAHILEALSRSSLIRRLSNKILYRFMERSKIKSLHPTSKFTHLRACFSFQLKLHVIVFHQRFHVQPQSLIDTI